MLVKIHSKKKIIPVHAWKGSEGYRSLRLPDLKAFDTWRW